MPMTPELPEGGRMTPTQRAVADAIERTFNDHGHMITKWTLIAEGIDAEDGERGCWMITPDGQTAWDSLGLLTYALQVEQAGLVVDTGYQDDES